MGALSLLGPPPSLCWLIQPLQPMGTEGTQLPPSQSMSENLWLFLVCFVRMCNYYFFLACGGNESY